MDKCTKCGENSFFVTEWLLHPAEFQDGKLEIDGDAKDNGTEDIIRCRNCGTEFSLEGDGIDYDYL